MARKVVRRQGKCTDDVIAKLSEGARLGLPNRLCAPYAGISLGTLDHWIAQANPKHPKYHWRYVRVVEAIQEGKARGAAGLLARVQQAARDDPRPAQWLLERVYGFRKPGSAPVGRPPSVNVNVEQRVQQAAQLHVIDADATPLQIAEERLHRVHRQLLDSEKAGSHQATAALNRQFDEARAGVQALREGGEGEPEEAYTAMQEETYASELMEAAARMPEQHLSIFAREWLERHRLDTQPRRPRLVVGDDE